jgi:hypothetical protein
MRWEMRLGLERSERQKGRRDAVGRGVLALGCLDGAARGLRASSGHTSTRALSLHCCTSKETEWR